MRSRKNRSTEASVTLFPFLAVLICTMGALIVLLVVVVQQARSQAESIAADKSKTIEERLAQQSSERADRVAEMQLQLDDFKCKRKHERKCLSLHDNKCNKYNRFG